VIKTTSNIHVSSLLQMVVIIHVKVKKKGSKAIPPTGLGGL
jgi:hypothetical protein